ncbi:helix-turn-helix transcriptional regulator [Paenibacillus albicereus]|uniref:Helix-turn-helix transcriptional regulator n=1 Tax=Paenibacillus albicereus TaxID=2726185 RepID=A0A6H2GS14_9BACL|nr:AraC family transcriptional regulator [Paenibacillus albicereus]QJC50185.1 helix-turn-helix transcriptional regulator [Paenibacillus albicereus]
MTQHQSIQKAIAYMEARLHEPLPLERIAAEAGFSAYHFHRLFREHTGRNVGEYLRMRRLALASRRLLEEERGILDLALSCGFESQEAFTRAFKRLYGLPPGRYRRLFLHHQSARERMESTMSTNEALSSSPLKGWFLSGSHPHQYRISLDRSTIHQGSSSGQLESLGETDPGGFATLMQQFRADTFRGKRMRLSGFVRTRGASGFCGLWMRVDNAAEDVLQFDNMNDRPLAGDLDWNHYSIVLDVPEESAVISLGVLLYGPGRVWLDSLRFEEVDASVPTTGQPPAPELPAGPVNLHFED